MDYSELYEEANDRYQQLMVKLQGLFSTRRLTEGIDEVAEAVYCATITRLSEKRQPEEYRDLAALILYKYGSEQGIRVAFTLDSCRPGRAYERIVHAMETLDDGDITCTPFLFEVHPSFRRFLRGRTELGRLAREFLTQTILVSPNSQDDILMARSRYAGLSNEEKKKDVASALEIYDPIIAQYITQ
jgi:hypothetical protein